MSQSITEACSEVNPQRRYLCQHLAVSGADFYNLEFHGINALGSDQVDSHLPGLVVLAVRNLIQVSKISNRIDLRALSVLQAGAFIDQTMVRLDRGNTRLFYNVDQIPSFPIFEEKKPEKSPRPSRIVKADTVEEETTEFDLETLLNVNSEACKR